MVNVSEPLVAPKMFKNRPNLHSAYNRTRQLNGVWYALNSAYRNKAFNSVSGMVLYWLQACWLCTCTFYNRTYVLHNDI
jgi:hypothetical protein